jgi:hypothetical protein
MADKPQAKEEKPPPQCKAILLCQQTIVEADTASVSLIGIIHEIAIPGFPGQTRSMEAFLQLVDGIGRYDINVEVHDLREDRIIAKATGPRVDFPNRLATLQLAIPVPSLPIAHQGRYDLIVFANGREIDRQQFTAVSSEEYEGGET